MRPKDLPSEPSKRDTWESSFIVEIQHGSDLRLGKFLKALAAEQWHQCGETLTGEAAAKGWLSRQPGKR